MGTVLRWYERLLGAALVLFGVVCLVPVYWVWSRHMYTIGLSIDTSAYLAAVIVTAGLVMVLGGVGLLRRR